MMPVRWRKRSSRPSPGGNATRRRPSGLARSETRILATGLHEFGTEGRREDLNAENPLDYKERDARRRVGPADHQMIRAGCQSQRLGRHGKNRHSRQGRSAVHGSRGQRERTRAGPGNGVLAAIPLPFRLMRTAGVVHRLAAIHGHRARRRRARALQGRAQQRQHHDHYQDSCQTSHGTFRQGESNRHGSWSQARVRPCRGFSQAVPGAAGARRRAASCRTNGTEYLY